MRRHRFRPGPAYWDGRCLRCGMWESAALFRDFHWPWWAFWRTDTAAALRPQQEQGDGHVRHADGSITCPGGPAHLEPEAGQGDAAPTAGRQP